MSKFAWMRKLIVTLTSVETNSSIIYGDSKGDNLNISVKGTKYLSPFRDEFTVEISNIPLLDIIKLRDNKHFLIKIEAGYESSGIHTVFDGGVLYISNRKDDHNTNTCVILCASKAVAWYGQNKMSVSISSGINMYQAYAYITKLSGIKNISIDDNLKKIFLTENESNTGSVTNWISNLSSTNSSILVSSDSSGGNVLSIWSDKRSLRGKIKLDSNNIIAQGGFPRLTENGVQIKILPTIGLLVGDTVTLDNSIINIYAESKEDVYKNYNYYMNQSGDYSNSEGEYIIYQIDYFLENRGRSFELELNLRSKKLYGGLFK